MISDRPSAATSRARAARKAEHGELEAGHAEVNVHPIDQYIDELAQAFLEGEESTERRRRRRMVG